MGVVSRMSAVPDELWHGLFVAEFARVVAVCRSLGTDDPEDVAQEAFVRTYHHRERIGTAAERGYLYVTAVNLVRTRSRRKSLTEHGFALLPPEPAGVDEHVVAVIDGERVRRAVRQLNDKDREAVVLRYWAGLTDLQIADALGQRPGTVRSRLSRALKRVAALHEESER